MTCAASIRRALVHEREALEALQWRASLNNIEDREALLANPDAISLPDMQIATGQVFVAERDGAIVGFAAVLSRTDGAIELDGMFVDPHIWRQGIGRSLIEYCNGYARALGAATLHVVGNPQAEGFYRACGFVAKGTCQTRFGVGLLMEKEL